MSARVSAPEPRSQCGAPVCEPPHLTPENGALVSSPECFNHPPAFWGHALGWGHQASNQSLPPLPGISPKLNSWFQVRHPSRQAPFPPAFIWEVGVSIPWSPRSGGRAVGPSPSGQSHSCGAQVLALAPSGLLFSELSGSHSAQARPAWGAAPWSLCRSFLLPALAAPRGRGLAQGHARLSALP